MPAPFSTSSCPPTLVLSASLTPPTSAESAADDARSIGSAMAMMRNMTIDSKNAAPQGWPCGALAKRSSSLLSGRVSDLQADDVDVALVRAVYESVERGAAFVLVDARVAYEDVRIREIDRPVVRELVLRAECEPGAVVVGEPRRPLGLAHRCLIPRQSAAQRPFVGVPVICADGDAPRIAEILRGGGEHDAGGANDL